MQTSMEHCTYFEALILQLLLDPSWDKDGRRVREGKENSKVNKSHLERGKKTQNMNLGERMLVTVVIVKRALDPGYLENHFPSNRYINK